MPPLGIEKVLVVSILYLFYEGYDVLSNAASMTSHIPFQ